MSQVEIVERGSWFAKPEIRVLTPTAREEEISCSLFGNITVKAGTPPDKADASSSKLFTLSSYLCLGRIHVKTGEITISGEEINRHSRTVSRAISSGDGFLNLSGHRVVLKWIPTSQPEQPKK